MWADEEFDDAKKQRQPANHVQELA